MKSIMIDAGMKQQLGWLLGLLLSMACSAAEIVAWKVPLLRLGGIALDTEGVVRCKTAPEPSPFLKEGDEIWDLTGVSTEKYLQEKVALDWIVWDASSGRVVAKAKWDGICALNGILRPDGLPTHCRLTMDLYEVAADGAPLSAAAVPVAGWSVVARSGHKCAACWSGDGKRIDFEVEVAFGDSDRPIMDVRICGSAEVPGQLPMEINTAFHMRQGKPLWVARDFDGRKGLDVVASAVVESLDGTPYRERVMLQKGDRTVSAVPEMNTVETQRVGEVGWLTSIALSPADLMRQLFPDSVKDEDPFAVPTPDLHIVLPSVPVVRPPDFLRPWLDHEVLDAGEWIGKMAPDLKGHGEFTGYDPMSGRFYFFSRNRQWVEQFEMLFQVLDGCVPPLVVVSFDGAGQTRLVGKSGQKATLTRGVDPKAVKRSIESEPTIGESDEIIDLRLDYCVEPDPQQTTYVNTSVTLQDGKPMRLLDITQDDGKKSSLHVKAEITREVPGQRE